MPRWPRVELSALRAVAAQRKPSPGTLAVALSLVVAYAARVLWIHHVESPLDTQFSDMGGYMDRARTLLHGVAEPYPRYQAFYPFGAHYLYAAELGLVGETNRPALELLHAAWGTVPAGFVAASVLRVARRAWVAALAGVAFALWPPLLSYTGYFSSEQLFAGLVAANGWATLRFAEGRGGWWAVGTTAALGFAVRPQIVLTMALLGGLFLLAALRAGRRRGRVAFRRLALASLPLLAMMLFAAARYHHLSGQVGLISDNDALQRLFADTSIASVESWERLPDGSTRGFAFTPPGKFTLAETELYRFEGYIGDREKLGAARRRRTAGVPWTARVSRWARNAGLLVTPDFVWPEVERAKRGWRQRLHEWMQPMLRWILPLAFVGLVGAAIRPRPVVVIAVAHLVTSAFSAALYFGEARYRVPYDAFVFVLAVSGLVVLVRLASHVWRRRSPAGRLASA